ncbi:hypothetical protein GOV12_01885 [Candidatus Pacearchaeota archaeon]|nr:hypothetical protein [Candidatus Pacearchaeota archaeon]
MSNQIEPIEKKVYECPTCGIEISDYASALEHVNVPKLELPKGLVMVSRYNHGEFYVTGEADFTKRVNHVAYQKIYLADKKTNENFRMSGLCDITKEEWNVRNLLDCFKKGWLRIPNDNEFMFEFRDYSSIINELRKGFGIKYYVQTCDLVKEAVREYDKRCQGGLK